MGRPKWRNARRRDGAVFTGIFFYFVSVLWLTDNAVAAARKEIERVA